MRLFDIAGYLAAGLVIGAFCMKDIVPLRVVALASNIAFLVYGIGLDLLPVCLLHAILFPINGWRLGQVIVDRRASEPIAPAAGYPRVSRRPGDLEARLHRQTTARIRGDPSCVTGAQGARP
jgi:hypothetical protein